jgi:Rod binding domain-containing protein
MVTIPPLIPSSPARSAASADPPARRDSPAKIAKCATDFESLLLAQMLRSARQAGGSGLTGDDDDGNEANTTLLEVGEQQFAQALASRGGLGIAKMVVAGLTPHANR